MKELDYILKTLLAEKPEYKDIAIPSDRDGKRQLMQILLTVRPPVPVSKAFIRAQDIELQRQRDEKGVIQMIDIQPCTTNERLKLWHGDITRLGVDAIVNAANDRLLGCFVPLHKCIDNAIHSAAGIQLRLDCHAIMQAQGHTEPTGSAQITKGYNLPARYVMHTVGPIIGDRGVTQKDEMELAACYQSCLTLADDHTLESIAFCCISTGEFCFPNQRAAEIAIHTVTDYFLNHPETGITTVIFNVFKHVDYSIYHKLLS